MIRKEAKFAIKITWVQSWVRTGNNKQKIIKKIKNIGDKNGSSTKRWRNDYRIMETILGRIDSGTNEEEWEHTRDFPEREPVKEEAINKIRYWRRKYKVSYNINKWNDNHKNQIIGNQK